MRLFLDIGAFNGALSLRAAESGLYDEVHAFEPNPVCRRPNHHIIYHTCGAAWHAECLLLFHFGQQNGEPTQGGSFFADKQTGGLSEQREVQGFDLGHYIISACAGATSIDIHMDAEGAEYVLLPHLIGHGLADRITRLSVEWHADKIPSISAATDKAVRAMVAALDKPECLVREE